MNASSCLQCFKVPEEYDRWWPDYPYNTGAGPTNHGNAVPRIPMFRRIVPADNWGGGGAWSYWKTQASRDEEMAIHKPGNHNLRLGADGELVRMDK